MKKSDYDKYYKKGGTYVIPVEVFNELFDELERLSFNYEQALEDLDKKDNIINKLEKDFERKIQSCTIEAETTTNDFYCRLHIATLKKWLNKIQELKGSE